MKVIINGEESQHDAATVADLVKELGLPAPTLLIEHNGTALRRNEWADTQLVEGDRLEILRVSAGG